MTDLPTSGSAHADTLDILDGNNEESDFDEDGLTNWEEYLLGLIIQQKVILIMMA